MAAGSKNDTGARGKGAKARRAQRKHKLLDRSGGGGGGGSEGTGHARSSSEPTLHDQTAAGGDFEASFSDYEGGGVDEFDGERLDHMPDQDLLASFGGIDVGSVVLYPWESDSGSCAGAQFTAALNDIAPRYVIVADVNQTIVRQLEVYQYFKQSKIRVFLLGQYS